MTQNSKKLGNKPLGKGLDELLGPHVSNTLNSNVVSQVKDLDINLIKASIEQPRNMFVQEELKQLADSMKEHGLIQPIIVRKALDSNFYLIVAGERRWRAAQILGWNKIPAIIKNLDDNDTFAVAIVENIQRSNLTPLEEALAYKNLITRTNKTQEKISELVGKSRSYVANTIRLLALPINAQECLNKQLINTGHARCLLGLKEKQVNEIIDEIVEHKLNVRQTEELVSGLSSGIDFKVDFKKTIEKDKNLPLKKELSNDVLPHNIDSFNGNDINPHIKKILALDSSNKSLFKLLPSEFEKLIKNHKDNYDTQQIENNISKNTGLKTKMFCHKQEGIIILKFNNMKELDKISKIFDIAQNE